MFPKALQDTALTVIGMYLTLRKCSMIRSDREKLETLVQL